MLIFCFLHSEAWRQDRFFGRSSIGHFFSVYFHLILSHSLTTGHFFLFGCMVWLISKINPMWNSSSSNFYNKNVDSTVKEKIASHIHIFFFIAITCPPNQPLWHWCACMLHIGYCCFVWGQSYVIFLWSFEMRERETMSVERFKEKRQIPRSTRCTMHNIYISGRSIGEKIWEDQNKQ